MAKRQIAGASMLLMLVLLATNFLSFNSRATHASGGGIASTVNALHTITTVGSTQFILNAKGQTISTDANPYGVAIAPAGINPGVLQSGDVVVTNFGTSGLGTTLVRFPQQAGPGLLYNTATKTNGPAAEVFSNSGNLWIANFAGNNIQIFDTNGNLAVTYTNPLFNHPWGQGFNGATPNPIDGSIKAFFSTNAGDGTIDRIDIIPQGSLFQYKTFQIGKLPRKTTSATPVVAPQGMAWVPTWNWSGVTYHDVLFVVDAAQNRIAAYVNSSTRNTTSKRSTDQGITVFAGTPLNRPVGLAINPINGDLLVVNQLDNNVVELSPSGQVVGTQTLDKTPVNAKTGVGSALFGLAATTDMGGNLVLYYTDDLTNTLDKLSA